MLRIQFVTMLMVLCITPTVQMYNIELTYSHSDYNYSVNYYNNTIIICSWLYARTHAVHACLYDGTKHVCEYNFMTELIF